MSSIIDGKESETFPGPEKPVKSSKFDRFKLSF